MRFAFGDCVLDSDTREVTRAGQPVSLPPKSYSLLELLIRQRSRAVSKDEIHRHLWRDTHVADASLANLVAQLRAALGDDAHRPSIIRTVPRFGYSFIAGTKELPPAASPDGGMPVSHPLEEPAAEPSSAREGITTGSRGKRFVASVRLAIVAGTLAVASLAVFGVARYSRPGFDSVVVLPLAARASDPTAEYLGESITDYLIDHLSRLPDLRVVSRASLAAYGGAVPAAGQIERELDAEAVLTGSVVRSGDMLTISVELSDARDGRHLWGDRYVRPLSAISSLESEMAREIVDGLADRMTESGDRRFRKNLSRRPVGRPADASGP